MVQEKIFRPASGWSPLFCCLAMILAGPLLIVWASAVIGPQLLTAVLIPLGVVTALAGVVGLFGCMPVAPNQARVLLLFGEYKGSVTAIVYQLVGGLRASMGYCGCRDIEAMRANAGFVEITGAGMRESHVHDVQIVKEAPNYQVN